MFLKQLFLLAATVASVVQCACFDNGDKEIGGSCFKFVPQKLKFEDARNWCHYQNPVTASYLAYVPNQFTSNFLASYARSAFGSDDGNFWIGLSRQGAGSPWTWDNGAPLGFTNFGDQMGNYAAESIVNAKWPTFGKDVLNYFVCSYDPAAPPTFAPMSPTPNVPTSPVFTTQDVPTTTDAALCSPTTNTTYLFAYSNDMDPKEVQQAVSFLYLSSLPAPFTWLADVRFDVHSSSSFYFHSNWDDFDASVYAHMPDKALRYSKSNTGSDVIRMLELYLQQTEYPICGTRALILMRRYSNETDITNIVEKLQKYHIFLTIVSPIPKIRSGGLHPETMYQIATKTNGLCVFEDRNFRYDSLLPSDGELIYLLGAANAGVLGQSSVSLPQLIVNEAQYFHTIVTVQDHGPTDSFQWMKLSFKGSNTGQEYMCEWDKSFTHGSYVICDSLLFSADTYHVTLDCRYSNQKVQWLQVRYNSKKPVYYWTPFDN